MEDLNAHEKSPEAVRQLFKRYQKISLSEIESHPDIIDLQRVDENGPLAGGLQLDGHLPSDTLKAAFEEFMSTDCESFSDISLQDVPIFTHPAVSGQP